MTWRKGQSGNPAGRPKRGDADRARLRDRIYEHLPAILDKLAKQAREGDVQASRLLLERVLPPMRAEAAPLSLPALVESTDLAQTAQALLQAAGRGEVPLDLAARLLTGISSAARTVEANDEIHELERRIAALEAKG